MGGKGKTRFGSDNDMDFEDMGLGSFGGFPGFGGFGFNASSFGNTKTGNTKKK
jgi:hypothetical protein